MHFALNSGHFLIFQLCFKLKNMFESIEKQQKLTHTLFSVPHLFNTKTKIKQIFQTLFSVQEIIWLTWPKQFI